MNIVHLKEHRSSEKEESSSYLSRFLCLDKVGHHNNCSSSKVSLRIGDIACLVAHTSFVRIVEQEMVLQENFVHNVVNL